MKKTNNKVKKYALIKRVISNIDKPNYNNFTYIAGIYILATIIIAIFFIKDYNENIGDLPFNIYLALSTLMIPLAIYVAQKISDSEDFLETNVYIRQSHIFPITIFQIISFISLFCIKNQVYYWILIILYAGFIAYIYTRTLRLFSDSIYFEKNLKKETKNIIKEAMSMHIKSNNTKSTNIDLAKYGIYFDNIILDDTELYETEYIYPVDDNLLINEISSKNLIKLINIMTEINIEEQTEEINKVIQEKKKIKIFLKSEGYTTKIKEPIIKILFWKDDNNCIESLSKIKNVLYGLYKYEDYNLDIVIEQEIQEIEKKCIVAISNNSITELENNLKLYVGFYNDIVDELEISTTGSYSLKDIDKAIHSLSTFRGFKYFEYIKRELYNLCNHPNSLKSKLIFNKIISCIYEMLLYSYSKCELISFTYVSEIYEMLVDIVNENEELDIDKIQIELFEILNYIYYELNNSKNKNYNKIKDMIIILNKVIVNIMFNLIEKDKKKFYVFRNKFIKFISNVEEEINQKGNSIQILDILEEILTHCSSNLFAMDSYIFEKQEKEVRTNIIKYYNEKSFKYVLSAYLNAHRLQFQDIYNWEMWEKYDYLNDDNAHWVKTGSYLDNLFCNICVKYKNIKLYENKDLVSYYNNNLKNIFISLGCNDNDNVIIEFENMIKKYEENGKKYLRETSISEEKKNDFISKFIECYMKENNLYNLMNKYDNIKIIKPSKRRKKLFRN